MTFPLVLIYILAALLARPEAVGPPTGEYGRLVCPDGYWRDFEVYDEIWLSRAIECEAGRHADGREGDAIAWTLASRYCRMDRSVRPRAFTTQAVNYCQCLNPAWGTTGTRKTERGIEERVDYYRSLPLREVPRRSREAARRFLTGRSTNPIPGATRWLAQGYERFADRRWIGPLYLNPRGGNAFYRVPETRRWNEETVRVIPPVSQVQDRSRGGEPGEQDGE